MDLAQCVELDNMSLAEDNINLKVTGASIINSKDSSMHEEKSCGVLINGIHTDIVIKNYRNRTLLILSQFRKFGSFITVTREEAGHSHVYTIKTILGQDDIDTHVAARYIAEKLSIEKPLLLTICLKDYSLDTMKILVAAIEKLNL